MRKKCCKNCKHLVVSKKKNAYKDDEYFCLKIGSLIFNISCDIDKTKFYKYSGFGEIIDKEAMTKCNYEESN